MEKLIYKKLSDEEARKKFGASLIFVGNTPRSSAISSEGKDSKSPQMSSTKPPLTPKSLSPLQVESDQVNNEPEDGPRSQELRILKVLHLVNSSKDRTSK